ncbi:MAG: hypothetical protein ACO3IW_03760 [Burkholderiales bacterium]
MNNRTTLQLVAALLLAAPAGHTAEPSERSVQAVQFAKSSSSASIQGSIRGYHYVDYQLRAGAGQTLKVGLKAGHIANYFNILPPDSIDAAMYNASMNENRFEGLLPADGVYTVRVYLMRAAARRNESSAYTLSVSITGKPLAPLSPKVDALIPGTPFHARTTARCEPAYSKTRECEASVIRRGHDGTATVELRWDRTSTRRILFIQGKPVASDTMQAMTYTRNDRAYFVRFGGDERFEIPEALVFGG